MTGRGKGMLLPMRFSPGRKINEKSRTPAVVNRTPSSRQ